MEERLAAHEAPRTLDRVCVAGRPDLLHEGQPPGVLADRVRIGRLIAGADHDADFLDAGAQCFLDDDAQHGLLDAVPVDQRLQRQRSLIAAGGGDDGLGDFHGDDLVWADLCRIVRQLAPKRKMRDGVAHRLTCSDRLTRENARRGAEHLHDAWPL